MLSTLLIFALCVTAGVYADKDADLENENQVFSKCVEERGIASEEKWGSLDNEKSAHLAACFYISQGIMNPDGTLNLEFVESFKDDEFDKATFAKIYEMCKDKIDHEFMQCLAQNESNVV